MTNDASMVTGVTEPPLLDLTINDLLVQASEMQPDREALVSCHQNIRLTYAELDAQSDALAKGFVSLGLERGDRVGIWSPNNIEWVLCMYAAARIGLILVNINPAYRPLELEYALRKVGCRAVVLAHHFKSSNYPEMIRQLAPEIGDDAGSVLNSAALPELQHLILIGDEEEDGFLSFDALLESGRQSDIDLQELKDAVDVHDAVNIQFTSGTTGSPKGATLTHHNIVNNGYFVGRGMEINENDRICVPVPLYHCFGMVMGVLCCAAHQVTCVMPDASFDPMTTLQAVSNESCTALYGVPTMFTAVLNHPEFATSLVNSLRTGIVAGSLCPSVLMTRILEDLQMKEITNCYGMTETSPVSFQSAIDDEFEKRISTVGTIHPHVQVKIVNSEGEVVPRGARGEICTTGYSVMLGYWADTEKTEEAIVDGWMHTGDEGVIDEDGYCAIVGRIKDTIIRGGENIAPKEIEEYLLTHADVLEAQVFGIPDEQFGEIVCAWIKKTEDASLSTEDVQQFCKDKIAHYKIPAMVKFVDEYPMTVTGKVQKFVMRDQMVKEISA